MTETITITMTKKQAVDLLTMLDASEIDDTVGGVVVGNRIRRAIGQTESLPSPNYMAWMAGKTAFPDSDHYLDEEYRIPESAWTEQ